MKLELQTVLDYGLQNSAEVLNLEFSDYIVPIQMDSIHFHELLRTSHIDVSLSHVVLRDRNALGVALISRRGWCSRLAGMSIIPEARGQKIGTWLMEQLISESISRGDRRMELEVIGQNMPAVKLYQKMGFQTMRRLFSWKLEAPEGEPGHPIEIDIRQLADLVNIHGLPNLPWQLSGENLAPMGYPNQAYRLDDAYLAISNPNKEHIIIRSLLTLADSRGKGQAARLLCALFARFLEKNWIVPAISPEEMNGFFKNLDFKMQDLSQLQMELVFNENAISE